MSEHSTLNTQQSKLPVMESFYTIQGEGKFSGVASYFIRLGGCDVGCVWCDVKESWGAANHPLTSIASMVSEASQYPGRVVVITGGEPLMYDLTELTKAFKAAGFRTHVETSGAYPMSGDWDWVCFSPKKFKAPVPGFAATAHELKVIVFHKSDFEFAALHQKEVGTQCELFLQPEWSKQNDILPKVIDFVKANPVWKISLQTHKYMDIP
jgi:organic radical activating enzyme